MPHKNSSTQPGCRTASWSISCIGWSGARHLLLPVLPNVGDVYGSAGVAHQVGPLPQLPRGVLDAALPLQSPRLPASVRVFATRTAGARARAWEDHTWGSKPTSSFSGGQIRPMRYRNTREERERRLRARVRRKLCPGSPSGLPTEEAFIQTRKQREAEQRLAAQNLHSMPRPLKPPTRRP